MLQSWHEILSESKSTPCSLQCASQLLFTEILVYKWRRDEWGLLWYSTQWRRNEWGLLCVVQCTVEKDSSGKAPKRSKEGKLQPRLWGSSVSITAMPVSPIFSKRFKMCQRRMLGCDLETVLVTFWQRMSLLFAPVGDVYLRLKWKI